MSKIVAVPAARYEGNEDGRGGFGALQYEHVFSQLQPYNTDPDHPMFAVLHHDGDNFGGGSESYYHGNFQSMVNWASGNGSYNVTTIQDYLDKYPVDADDVIHVENGSWAGADNGDPEFKKWLGDPGPDGWSPDRNSWAVLTAAKNHVYTADDVAPATNLDNVIDGTGSATERAWHTLLQAQASDHWYWDGTELWDSNVTLGSNLAVAEVAGIVASVAGEESTPPTVFVPRRESYNPGGSEWGSSAEPSDFEIWTFAYDVSGLEEVVLMVRVDEDGVNPLDSIQNETYAGGEEVGSWVEIAMTGSAMPAPPAGVMSSTVRAEQYAAMVTGYEDVLLDYYVEAVDLLGNVTRTDIQHVYVGEGVSVGGEGVVQTPVSPVAGELVTVTYDASGGVLSGAGSVWMHYGINDWATVYPDLLMNWDATEEVWSADIVLSDAAERLDIVFNDGSGVWDNNNGSDWHFDVAGGGPIEPSFVMDGSLDGGVSALAEAGGRGLYASVADGQLYVATESAGEGQDVFIVVALTPGDLTSAMWGKSGQVAGWDAFLADENDNDYVGWFDTQGTALLASGGVLEGVLDLEVEFGSLPEFVYLAVVTFATADGGVLVDQVPGSVDGNAWVEALEFVRLRVSSLAGDVDLSGRVDLLDLSILAAHFGDTGVLPSEGDLNDDGVIDLLDLSILASNFGKSADVPEPGHGVLVALGLAGLRRR
ncbi:carbohydrate-binding protein [Mucisphaera calidilacus]|uniref:carbohydrate-binding protein n=1 Tax=Mucisphaera calidilacus TaxID=2527982 RepID=UPI0011AA6F3B|nr:carbohydrate-binding protein [Mucisphaera calidilacus]